MAAPTQIPGSPLERTPGAIFENPSILRLWHLTSLDASSVAVNWSLAFSWVANIHLAWWLPTILGLSAWSFYIADRVLDARPASPKSADPCRPAPVLQPRHNFHWTHRRILIPVAAVSALIAVALVLRFMPAPAQVRNSTIAVAALAYFAAIHLPIRTWFKVPKELLVAIIFTCACALPVIAMTPAIRFTMLLEILTFITLAWLNCFAIEIWESGSVREDFKNGRATNAASSRLVIGRLALTFFAAALLLAVACAAFGERRSAALIASAATSAILLGLLDLIRPRLTPTTLRAAADLVLLTPVALLLPGFWPR